MGILGVSVWGLEKVSRLILILNPPTGGCLIFLNNLHGGINFDKLAHEPKSKFLVSHLTTPTITPKITPIKEFWL